MTEQTALKYELEIKEDGHVEIDVPFPAGTHIIVFVLESGETFHDLLTASKSSLDFWNNPFDDEDWNNA
jgi:hypothetical protein